MSYRHIVCSPSDMVVIESSKLRAGKTFPRTPSFRTVARTYWKPTYEYVRLRWHKAPVDAEEITQEFFLHALERSAFAGYDARRARFGTFLRACVDRFVVDVARYERAKKRGGEALFLPLDVNSAELELETGGKDIVDPEVLLEREWVKSLLEVAADAFRAVCKRKGKVEHFRVFELIHLSDTGEAPSYAQVANQLRISVRDVENRLVYARREFRAEVLNVCRALAPNTEVFANMRELHAFLFQGRRRLFP